MNPNFAAKKALKANHLSFIHRQYGYMAITIDDRKLNSLQIMLMNGVFASSGLKTDILR